MKGQRNVKQRKEEEEIAGWTRIQKNGRRVKRREERWAQQENSDNFRGQESRGKEERRWKGLRIEWAFVGVDVMALCGMCLQGAKGPQSGGKVVEGV